MFIIEQTIAWAIGLSMGFIFSEFFVSQYKNKKFGGWSVVIRKGDEHICVRAVGARKAEEVLDDASTLSVFIKGVVSPFGWLNEDILAEKAQTSGLFTISFPKKQWVVDLAKNPPAPPKKG